MIYPRSTVRPGYLYCKPHGRNFDPEHWPDCPDCLMEVLKDTDAVMHLYRGPKLEADRFGRENSAKIF